MSAQASSVSVGNLAVKSVLWYGATRLWGQGLSWVVTLVLARLLAPEDYGLFAMALSVLALLELLQEFGLGTAIVQRQHLNRGQINAVFWAVASTSLLLTVTTYFAAGPVSRFYAEPRLLWTLRLLCLTFLLNSLGMVPYSLLTKAIDLRRRSLAEAMGTVTSAMVAMGLAWCGYGVWALVCGHLARAVVLNTALIVFSRWLPSFEVTMEGMWSVIAFGLRIVGTHLVGNFLRATTTFIVARFLGGGAVGLYAMAQGLSEAPHRVSTAIITQVSLPVFSRLQAQTEVLGSYYLKISKYLAVVSLPVQVGLILVAPDLITALLSDKWAEMVVPFQFLCFESIVIVLSLTASPLLTARGRASLLLGRSTLSLVCLTLAAAVGAMSSLAAVAAARAVTMLPLRASVVLPALGEVRLSASAYIGNLVAPLLATGAMVGAVLVVRHAGLDSGSAFNRLVLSVAVGVLTYPAALLLLDRALGTEIKVLCRDVLFSSRA